MNKLFLILILGLAQSGLSATMEDDGNCNNDGTIYNNNETIMENEDTVDVIVRTLTGETILLPVRPDAIIGTVKQLLSDTLIENLDIKALDQELRSGTLTREETIDKAKEIAKRYKQRKKILPQNITFLFAGSPLPDGDIVSKYPIDRGEFDLYYWPTPPSDS